MKLEFDDNGQNEKSPDAMHTLSKRDPAQTGAQRGNDDQQRTVEIALL